MAKAAVNRHDDVRIERALRGEILYGDDFCAHELDAWFADETEGYSDLYYTNETAADIAAQTYGYAALLRVHGYDWLPQRPIGHLLGIGSATGSELKPLLSRTRRVTILEPSARFQAEALDARPVRYVQPQPSGLLPFADRGFDVIVCMGVLHHVANVSTVVREMHRVLEPGGFVLLREPTHSMGDWRRPRPGLTRRERGIPVGIFRSIVRDAGFDVVREARCMFSLTSRLGRLARRPVWSIDAIVKLDAWVCRWPLWSRRYHALNTAHKLRPTAMAFVLRKPGGPA